MNWNLSLMDLVIECNNPAGAISTALYRSLLPGDHLFNTHYYRGQLHQNSDDIEGRQGR